MDKRLLDDDIRLTVAQLCRACGVSAEQLLSLVDEGVLEPEGDHPQHWQFQAISIRRIRSADRLQRDLGINRQGVALVLDLLDEIERLQRQLELPR